MPRGVLFCGLEELCYFGLAQPHCAAFRSQVHLSLADIRGEENHLAHFLPPISLPSPRFGERGWGRGVFELVISV